MHENIAHGMTTSKFLRNEEACNNGHGTLSNAYHCTFHSTQHLSANATNEKHDQYRLIGTLLRSVLELFFLLIMLNCFRSILKSWVSFSKMIASKSKFFEVIYWRKCFYTILHVIIQVTKILRGKLILRLLAGRNVIA